MGQQMSDHRMKRYRPKAFLVVALTAALVLAFAPLAWPQAAEDDDVPVVTVVASDGSAAEAGLTTGTFTVARNVATSAALTVDYAVGGSATAGSDYVALSGSVVIPADEVLATVTVVPLQDGVDENSETVTITLLSDPGYAVGSPAVATVIITDDDRVPVVWVLADDDQATEQGPTPGTFKVYRSGSTSSALTVVFALGGTADNGSDYAPLGASVIIPAGRSWAAVTVSPVDDGRDENGETVSLTLRSSTNYSIGSPSSATVTIFDNDGVAVSAANMPATKAACKKDGWRSFGIFKNQGDCVSWVATGGKNPPAGG